MKVWAMPVGQDVTATMRLAPAPVSGACPCAIAAAMMRSGAASAIQARHAASQSCLRRDRLRAADQQQDIAGLGRGAGIGLPHAGGVADFDIAVPAAFRGRAGPRSQARRRPHCRRPRWLSRSCSCLVSRSRDGPQRHALGQVGDDGRRGQVGAGQPELGDGEGDRQARHALGIRLFGQGRRCRRPWRRPRRRCWSRRWLATAHAARHAPWRTRRLARPSIPPPVPGPVRAAVALRGDVP